MVVLTRVIIIKRQLWDFFFFFFLAIYSKDMNMLDTRFFIRTAVLFTVSKQNYTQTVLYNSSTSTTTPPYHLAALTCVTVYRACRRTFYYCQPSIGTGVISPAACQTRFIVIGSDWRDTKFSQGYVVLYYFTPHKSPDESCTDEASDVNYDARSSFWMVT